MRYRKRGRSTRSRVRRRTMRPGKRRPMRRRIGYRL